MANDSSAILLDRLAAGDDAAASDVFVRYFDRLTRLARSRLHPRLVRRIDAEDVVLSAYRSFFVKAGEGAFSLVRSGDLWRLLAAIVIHKLRRQAKHHGQAKRAWQREADGEANLLEPLAREPSPAESIAVAQEVEAALDRLPKLERRICELRLQGVRLDEIAADVGRSERTVRRVVDEFRARLERQLLDEAGPGGAGFVPRGNEVAKAPAEGSSNGKPQRRMRSGKTHCPSPLTPDPSPAEYRGEGSGMRECRGSSNASSPWSRRSNEKQPSLPDPLATLPHTDYLLLRRLGTGGMGKVYLAWQKSQNRQVAVKVLKKSYWQRPGAVELFRQEATIVAQLRHPGIVAIHGLGQFPAGGYFIVMDYLPGGDLATQGGTSVMSLSEVLRWVAEVADAVHYAHQHGVVHCDLKPSNVLLDASGRAVVTDFGLARPVSNEWTNLVELAGTAAFMAPEQVDRAWGNIGPATDVYGLGGLLYALLTGRPPTMGASVLDSLARIVAGETPPALSTCRPDVPASIVEICERCLQPVAADRPPTSCWVAEQLRKLL